MPPLFLLQMKHIHFSSEKLFIKSSILYERNVNLNVFFFILSNIIQISEILVKQILAQLCTQPSHNQVNVLHATGEKKKSDLLEKITISLICKWLNILVDWRHASGPGGAAVAAGTVME